MELEKRVVEAIEKAEQFESKLTDEILEIRGWSSPKVRHFLNNLCSHPGTKYFEVGVWLGATFVAALYENEPSKVTAIDNFSEHWNETGYPIQIDESPELEEFLSNCQTYLGSQPNLLNQDFDSAITKVKGVHNVYFYDGGHQAHEQYNALIQAWPKLAQEFIFIVDDWNWESVQEGTRKALEDMNGTLLREWELPAPKVGDLEEWWNGLAVFVIRKNK